VENKNCVTQRRKDAKEKTKMNIFGKRRIVVRAVEPMSEQGMADALAIVEGHPIWRAVMQMVQDRYDEAVLLVSNPAAAKDPGLLAHCAGGLQAIDELRAALIEAREAAMQRREKVEKKS